MGSRPGPLVSFSAKNLKSRAGTSAIPLGSGPELKDIGLEAFVRAATTAVAKAVKSSKTNALHGPGLPRACDFGVLALTAGAICIYLRVSTRDQRDHSKSLEEQFLEVLQAALAAGYSVEGVFWDDHSGTDWNRPGYREMRKWISQRNTIPESSGSQPGP